MFRIKCSIMEKRPFDVTRDAWRVMQRKAMVVIGQHWHEKMLPNHFTQQAKYLYKHQPRSKKYLENKRRLAAKGKAIMGGVVDNVLTGEMMKAVLKNAIFRGYPTRCTVTMIGPSYMKSTGFSRKKLRHVTRQPNKVAELLMLTPREVEELKRLLKDTILGMLAAYRGRPRKTDV